MDHAPETESAPSFRKRMLDYVLRELFQVEDPKKLSASQLKDYFDKINCHNPPFVSLDTFLSCWRLGLFKPFLTYDNSSWTERRALVYKIWERAMRVFRLDYYQVAGCIHALIDALGWEDSDSEIDWGFGHKLNSRFGFSLDGHALYADTLGFLSMQLLRKLAISGNPLAQSILGKRLLFGEYCTQCKGEALFWLNRASLSNDELSLQYLLNYNWNSMEYKKKKTRYEKKHGLPCSSDALNTTAGVIDYEDDALFEQNLKAMDDEDDRLLSEVEKEYSTKYSPKRAEVFGDNWLSAVQNLRNLLNESNLADNQKFRSLVKDILAGFDAEANALTQSIESGAIKVIIQDGPDLKRKSELWHIRLASSVEELSHLDSSAAHFVVLCIAYTCRWVDDPPPQITPDLSVYIVSDSIAKLTAQATEMDEQAIVYLVVKYRNESAEKKSMEQALYWAKRGAQLENAFCNLFSGAVIGFDQKNLTEANPYLKEAYNQKSPEAAHWLAQCHVVSPKPDWEMIYNLYLEAIQSANSISDFTLYHYYTGFALLASARYPAEHDKVISHLKIASEKHAVACSLLGDIYSNVPFGTRQFSVCDYDLAKKYYDKAIKRGFVYAKTGLALLYLNGRNVEKDIKLAHALFDEVITSHKELSGELDSENARGYINRCAILACNNIGLLILNGQAEPLEPSDAEQYFQYASELGDETARNNLAGIYIGMERVDEAEELISDMASQGILLAEINMGAIYLVKLSQDGMYETAEKAIYWLQKAIEKGEATSHFKLGLLYYLSPLEKGDHKKSHALFTKAYELGYDYARPFIEISKRPRVIGVRQMTHILDETPMSMTFFETMEKPSSDNHCPTAG